MFIQKIYMTTKYQILFIKCQDNLLKLRFYHLFIAKVF